MRQLFVHAAMRYCKRYTGDALLFSTAGEMDLGGWGIQYVHFPFLKKSQAHKIAGVSELVNRTRGPKDSLRPLYDALCKRISGLDPANIRRNITLVNSDWTGRIVQQLYGIRTRTVYPPVQGTFPSVAWEDKEPGFVCVGRVTRNKRIETAIRILAGVRQAGFEVHLHIIGPIIDPQYVEDLLAMPELGRENWVSVEGNTDRGGLEEIVASHRYGIHAKPAEHFGISVAEMVRAGCIPFVPSSGGQVEIVSGREDLLFSTEAEGISKVTRLLSSTTLENDVRRALEQTKSRFTAERFQEEIRQVVHEVMLGRGDVQKN